MGVLQMDCWKRLHLNVSAISEWGTKYRINLRLLDVDPLFGARMRIGNTLSDLNSLGAPSLDVSPLTVSSESITSLVGA